MLLWNTLYKNNGNLLCLFKKNTAKKVLMLEDLDKLD